MTAAAGERTVKTTHDLLESFARSLVKVHFPETDQNGNPNLIRFFFDNGRLPYATDHIKPWFYRGWLIPYLQGCENHPLVPARYDYVNRTLEAGHLLNEPLPQISFVGEFEPAVKTGLKMLNDLLDFVERGSGSWNGMRDLCEWLAFALGVTTERSKLSDPVQEHLYRNFNLEPLLLNPSDYLGQMLCETNHGKRNGFYPTPIHIVEMMAQIVNAGKTGDRRGEKTHDPCVGTGRMMLVASNYSMRLFGQDIDPLCCLITKINLALYAPWYHIPESFFGDGENNEVEQPEIAPASDPKAPETAKTPERAEKTEFESNTANEPASAAESQSTLEKLRLEKQRITQNKSKTAQKHTTEIEQPLLWDFDPKTKS